MFSKKFLFLLCTFALWCQTDAQEEVTTDGKQFSTDYESLNAELIYCPEEKISFELVTGYVYSSPADMLDSQPGTLMLTECIRMCQDNKSCMSVNYETGLCVLFSSNSDMNPGQLTPSQFPVFTLYVQKTCIEKPKHCNRSWSFERTLGFALTGFEKKYRVVSDRHRCTEMCLREKDFPCRSANYNIKTGECGISDMDRHTAVGTKAFIRSEGGEYMESNCVDDPVRMCEFKGLKGKILKTVDSVFQDVPSLTRCKALCLTAPYRCHSFDFGDTGDKVCRLSHHAVATLTHIKEPYLEIDGSTTYELSSCYNVTIDCRSGDMVTRIKTSKIFNGKIYSKNSPNSCVTDVSNSLDFELVMPYHDVNCSIKRESPSRYSNDIIIQHHDMIVTSSDLGLSVHCQYDLSNKSVSNTVDLEVTGTIQPSIEEEMIVDSPNVIMRVTDLSGVDQSAAAVGDTLELRFEIVDMSSPYEIFVRELVALDGSGTKMITLMDEHGCPTDMGIMRELTKADSSGKILSALFDAFKFPSSDVVQFRALVTPCLPKCEPVHCNVMDFGGQMLVRQSYGRKKRSLMASPARTVFNMVQDITYLGENHLDISAHPLYQSNVRMKREASIPDELLVQQRITISDKFGFQSSRQKDSRRADSPNSRQASVEGSTVILEDVSGQCINTMGLILACSLFLVAQVILFVVWTAMWQRRRHNKLDEPLSHTTTTESLRQLYDSGYPRRI